MQFDKFHIPNDLWKKSSNNMGTYTKSLLEWSVSSCFINGKERVVKKFSNSACKVLRVMASSTVRTFMEWFQMTILTKLYQIQQSRPKVQNPIKGFAFWTRDAKAVHFKFINPNAKLVIVEIHVQVVEGFQITTVTNLSQIQQSKWNLSNPF